MNWYGTIFLFVEGRVKDLMKLPFMARAFEETMKQDGEPPDCVYEAECFARLLEDAVKNLSSKPDKEITKIEVREDCDTAHVPVFVIHAIADAFYFQQTDPRIMMKCEVVDSVSGEEGVDRLTYSPKTGRWYDREDLFSTMLITCGYIGSFWQDRLKQVRDVYAQMDGRE